METSTIKNGQQTAQIVYSATALGQKLQRFHRAQSVLGMVKDGLDGLDGPQYEQWADALSLAGQELDRLFDSLVYGKRV
jgi:hypothetical protein